MAGVQFPVTFELFGHTLHPHLVMEVIAYPAGFHLWLMLRRRLRPTTTPPRFDQSMWTVIGAIFGAAIGSKLLAWGEDWPTYWAHRHEPAAWIGGKTIVGGLLGGWAGVEIAKRCVGITSRTGDAYVFPLILGICLGRVGCFLTGLEDKTAGVATSLPWGVDFGDGVPRHPAQLYEIAFLLSFAAVLLAIHRRRWLSGAGQLFRVFIAGYLGFRFAAEFIKPVYAPYFGLSLIQVACLSGMIVCVRSMRAAATTPPHPRPLRIASPPIDEATS